MDRIKRQAPVAIFIVHPGPADILVASLRVCARFKNAGIAGKNEKRQVKRTKLDRFVIVSTHICCEV